MFPPRFTFLPQAQTCTSKLSASPACSTAFTVHFTNSFTGKRIRRLLFPLRGHSLCDCLVSLCGDGRPVAATCAFAQMNLSVDGSTVNNANNLHMLSIVICFTATPVFKDSYYSCSPSTGLYYSSQVWWSSSRDKTGLCYSRHEK